MNAMVDGKLQHGYLYSKELCDSYVPGPSFLEWSERQPLERDSFKAAHALYTLSPVVGDLD